MIEIVCGGVAESFDIGRRYERPPSEQASWFHDVLERIRSSRDGDVPIRLRRTTGHRVDGTPDRRKRGHFSFGPHGNVSINSHGEDLVIASEKVQAFTLLPGRSVDRGNQGG